MTATIAGYRTAILALLEDPTNIIFAALDVDQALRWALSEYSFERPLKRTYDYTVIGTTAFHTLPADFVTRYITKVEWWDASPDKIFELGHYAYVLDEQWVIHTNDTIPNCQVLQITYAAIHQIDGLDSAAGTTVPAADETMLQVGAAGRAALMRAIDRIETINMNQDVVKSYHNMGIAYTARFNAWLHLEASPEISLPDYPEIIF